MCASDLLRKASKEKQVKDLGNQHRKGEEAKPECDFREAPEGGCRLGGVGDKLCSQCLDLSEVVELPAFNLTLFGARVGSGEDLPRISSSLHTKSRRLQWLRAVLNEQPQVQTFGDRSTLKLGKAN